ncbi:hypothetical protein LTR15_010559 [Elasticomyces elasticus]|nr:hypothetical protein LTR15_010559 [Elasticomyces elasticus]
MAGTKRRQDEETRTSKKRTASTSTSSRAVTRQATRRAAAAPTNAVLLTTELLESVLRNLPTKDLLLAQRVSRKWCDLIRQSIVLQQQLFMRPRGADFAWHGQRGKVTKITVDEYYKEHGKGQYFLSGSLNRLLFEDCWKTGLLDRINTNEVLRFRFKKPTLQFEREDAPWRKIFVTQPPAESIDVLVYLEDGSYVELSVENPTGVTAGEVMDCLKSAGRDGVNPVFDSHQLMPDMSEYPNDEVAGMASIGESEDEGSIGSGASEDDE